MKAGKLDRKIALQTRSVTRSTFGEGVETFTDVAEVWAQVIYDRSGEKSRANDVQLQAQAVVTFRIRWRPDLTRDMRVCFDGNCYDVTNIMELGRREGADLQAVASVA